MSHAEPRFTSRRDLRKAVIRLRLELHRQQLQHETLLLTQPLRRMQGATRGVTSTLAVGPSSTWGVVGASLLGLMLKRRRPRGVLGMLRMGLGLLPLLRLARSKPHAASHDPLHRNS